jgi:hypothetical protein
MKIPLFYIEDTWCFITVYIHENNTFWIDFDYDSEYDVNFNENTSTLTLQIKNILCIYENLNYYCYNNLNKTIHNLKDIHSSEYTNIIYTKETFQKYKILYPYREIDIFEI